MISFTHTHTQTKVCDPLHLNSFRCMYVSRPPQNEFHCLKTVPLGAA